MLLNLAPCNFRSLLELLGQGWNDLSERGEMCADQIEMRDECIKLGIRLVRGRHRHRLHLDLLGEPCANLGIVHQAHEFPYLRRELACL